MSLTSSVSAPCLRRSLTSSSNYGVRNLSMDNDDIAPDTNYAENSNIRSVSSISNAVDGRSRTRKPFHFKTTIHNQTAGCSSSPEVVPNDEAQEATYFRYKYYQRLRGNQQTDEALLIPDHVVPRIFFYPYIPGTAARTGKQSSLITIFAIWNTMMGTSLLAMPWAIERAGLVAGLLLILIMASICLYTAYRNLQVFTLYGEKENLDDFPDLCAFLLGRTGQIVSVLFSALSLLGACVVYWVLMSNFLYNTVKYFFEFSSATETFGREGNGTFDLVCPGAENETVALDAFAVPTAFDNFWDLNLTVPLYLMAILLPLMCLKSATFFTKFNALGTLSVFYIVSFVSIKAGQWGWNVEVEDASSPLYIPFVRPSFPALSGMLSLALFLHNCVVAIMKNNRRPENNGRDLSIAYALVAMTYMVVGAVFFLSFPLTKSCIADNFLNNFSHSDTMTVAARVFLFFQMMTVFPLLTFILRSQILYAMFQSTYPGFPHVTVLNIGITAICVSFAIFLPQIGTIIRFSGALCGLVYIFTLPCILHIVSLRKQNEGKWPVGATVTHGLLVVLGVLNLIAQFIVTD